METIKDNSLIENLLSQNEINYISPLNFLINLILTITLSMLVGYIYTKYGRNISNRKDFSSNFALLSLITMLIITVVKSSLALSLGLVGALSIVRFRTPIKEPEELTYIFLCIAIGLANGADQYLAALICFILSTLGVLLSNYIRESPKVRKNTMRLSIRKIFISDINNILEILGSQCQIIELNNILIDQKNKNSETSVTLNIKFSSYEKLDHLLLLLNKNYPAAIINTIDLNNF